ncbi:glycosyltransferase family 2 protein [Nesterenkonia ebinurensis]|uniref:glycosyltransferase family 2 protein n=1 Tax=Nesterenkonia ebinurensis TaxID=2608252 RepID=UPI00168B9FA1|nr:glycosyltransferase family A protein [Nesterenkonia ebinurensis]
MKGDQALWNSWLLKRYHSQGASYGAEVEATALRSESQQMRRILAYGVTSGNLSYSELVDKVLTGSICGFSLDPVWLGRLASVCALQNTEPGDVPFATAAIGLANEQLARARRTEKRFLKLQAELLFDQRRFRELDAFLAQHPELRSYFHNYLTVDSRSPFVREGLGEAAEKTWLTGFNRQFTNNGLLPVQLRPGGSVPFNRLEVDTTGRAVELDTLVTVVMTIYRPREDDVLASARSILNQTWRNLELLIVDDASPPEYIPVLEALEQLDNRVRLIRLEINGGTYAARNVGIAHARGEFITGQDADDWSHPERIEIQAQDLGESPELPGNQVYTVNMTEDLVRIRRGYPPFIPSAPTLMVRARILRELGGYLPARKAADNELRGRVAAYTGTDVHFIKQPLIFMRILPDSLSRADFRPGWQHPARRAFWGAYKTWHASAPQEELSCQPQQRAPIHIPTRFTQPPQQRHHTDIVFAADWCEFGDLQANLLEEIHALLQSGRSVGILHMENALHLSQYARTLCGPAQELVSAGTITHLLADEDFHDVDLMLVRAPELLQFMPRGRTNFTPGALVVVAENPPTVFGIGALTYLPADCAQQAEAFFGRHPVWVPGSEAARSALQQTLPPEVISRAQYITPFSPHRWQTRRTRLRGSRPVIGAWSGSHPMEWPTEPAKIAALLPRDGSVDVRLYGQPGVLLRALGEEQLPPAWTAFPQGAILRSTYYRSLDAFIHFPHTPAVVPKRSVCEALGAGCLVVLPPLLQSVYGEAALYAEPRHAQTLIEEYLSDPPRHMRQAGRAAQFPHAVSGTAYVDVIATLTDDLHEGEIGATDP